MSESKLVKLRAPTMRATKWEHDGDHDAVGPWVRDEDVQLRVGVQEDPQNPQIACELCGEPLADHGLMFPQVGGHPGSEHMRQRVCPGSWILQVTPPGTYSPVRADVFDTYYEDEDA